MKWLALVQACSLLGTLTFAMPARNHNNGPNLQHALWEEDMVQPIGRAFDPNKVSSEVFYMAAPQPAESCPGRTMSYTAISPFSTARGTFLVPHTKIIESGKRCGTGLQTENMWLVSGSELTDPTAAFDDNVTEAFKALQIYPRVRNTFDSLSQVDLVYVGLELWSDRVCNGTVHWPRGSIFLFIKSNTKEIDFNNYGYVYGGETAMLGYKAVDPIPSVCAYKNSEIPGPNTSALLPTPSES